MEISNIIKTQKLQVTVLSVLIFALVFPFQIATAAFEEAEILPNLVIISTEEEYVVEENTAISFAVPRREYTVIRTLTIPITAYNSLPEQTDSTPCHTANGFDLCAHNQEDVIAANFLPFGTKVRFPEVFGDRIFTVQDRMNARYFYRADVWMREYEAAVKLGLVYTTIEVVE